MFPAPRPLRQHLPTIALYLTSSKQARPLSRKAQYLGLPTRRIPNLWASCEQLVQRRAVSSPHPASDRPTASTTCRKRARSQQIAHIAPPPAGALAVLRSPTAHGRRAAQASLHGHMSSSRRRAPAPLRPVLVPASSLGPLACCAEARSYNEVSRALMPAVSPIGETFSHGRRHPGHSS
jgi:hypothetical protein